MRSRIAGWLGVMFMAVQIGMLSGSAQTPQPASPATNSSSPAAPQIYVSDTDNDRIVRMDDMTGAGWTALGSRGKGTNQFHRPTAIFVDASGRVYVADYLNDRFVQMDDMTGRGWRAIGPYGALFLTDSLFRHPLGIAVGQDGSVYVADYDQVTRADSFAALTGLRTSVMSLSFVISGAKTREPVAPGGLALDTKDRIYLTDFAKHRIARVDNMKAAGWTTIGGEGVGTNQFHSPRGIAVDAAGHIYVADPGNNRIVRMDDMTGAGWTSLGSQGNGANEFNAPMGIAVDGSGRIYVADVGNQRIVRVNDMSGAGWVALGTQGSGVNQFATPFGIYVR
jgi:DNA-binding beta-propeller fold protein YncE